MNDAARLLGVKSKPNNVRELEAVLRDAGYSRNEAKGICAKGYKALDSEREADDLEQLLPAISETLHELKGKLETCLQKK
jgi:hypothetical protein